MVYEEIINGLMQSDYAWAAFFVIVSGLIAKAISIFMKGLETHASKTFTTLDDLLIPATRRPIMYLVLVTGFYFAVLSITALIPYLNVLLPAVYLVGISFGGLLIFRIGNTLLAWYTKKQAMKSEVVYNEVMPTVQKVWRILIIMVVAVMVLGQMGIEIGPLVTSLGIAGLAVALAFQDMLANFFAGFYLTTNRPIKKGQFIKLDSGQEGYVDSVDWRNTKLTSLNGQIVIVPNVKVSQAIITNYHDPIKKYPFMVSFTVRQDVDFEKLEEIVIAAAQKAIKSTPGADEKYPPLFRISDITDYGIRAGVIVQVHEYSGQYLLKHELFMELMRTFKKEGIGLAFPKTDLFQSEPTRKR